jgi:hypothetical protein
MASISEISWDQVADPDFGTPTGQAWRDAVQRVSAMAQAKLPDTLHGRIQRATALVLSGAVFLEEDGITCQVRASDQQRWYLVTDRCGCDDASQAPESYCKHRLAKALYRRAGELVREPGTTVLDAPETAPPTVPPQYVVLIQGRPFVRFAGLLQMAHERGLVALTADWTHNDAELSLAHAVARFENGKRFEECGDASPTSVTRQVAVHFRRVALTRAKARVLRDALGVDLVAVEELAE